MITKSAKFPNRLLTFSIGYAFGCLSMMVVALIWVSRQPAVTPPTQAPVAAAPSDTPAPLAVTAQALAPEATPPGAPAAGLQTPTPGVLPILPTRPVVRGDVQYLSLKIPAPALANNIVHEPPEQSVEIYLPPTYQSSEWRYPVVYFLPGFGSDPEGKNNFIAVDQLTEAMNEGRIAEMIIVVPNGANVLHGSFYVNSSVTGNWEDFILKDVIGYVDANYRTLAAPGGRGIAGHSMGGYAALSMAMRHPGLFGALYSMSGGFFAEDGLSTTFMFDERRKMRNYLYELYRYEHMSFDAALARMESIHGGAIEFATAYGAAFAPDPEGGSVLLHYPYAYIDGGLARDEEIWQQWENGFGNWPAKIAEYGANLRALKGMGFDYGIHDERQWIPPGNEYVIEQLELAGLSVEWEAFDGLHSDKLRERMLSNMLPFFSRMLGADD